jgi:hypothetical protein
MEIVPSVSLSLADETGEDDETAIIDAMYSDIEEEDEDKDVEDDEVTETGASENENKDKPKWLMLYSLMCQKTYHM